MFSSSNKAQEPHVMEVAETVVGRSFVLGTPDTVGNFHIFVDGIVWKIVSGEYQAGDRVHVMAADGGLMIVRK